MPHWKQEKLQTLLGERRPEKMFDQAILLAQDLGMVYLGLVLHLHIPARRPQTILYNNFPEGWNEHFKADRDFILQDPAISRSRISAIPVLWEDELYEEVPQFRETACSHGLRHGWTQSLYDRYNHESQLSVARAERRISDHELLSKSAQLLWLHNVLHELICEFHRRALDPSRDLTERELEVTKWTADGKTAADIACILSLSPSTVNFHIRSVITKLGVTNKTAAVAVAAARGLIWK
ncbi:autoinducer binding domain-containing protein [Pseudomonas sp. S75]|uniref:autoinducer binding domain-containing protein n=1 Tax=unclassified Pseudomonas TaxID=196821 RepID=UPI00190489EA|nr:MULTISPECIES: autoinducer binding domain-containing protein [unclassified Pseudomonas]MBJ9976780.1 autoinducer binding domain-containing protein [Pseudomonas sp. S30]MBK0153782.1 autoinducer binding domain-containing protein [Pseudomonas sp. S75]